MRNQQITYSKNSQFITITNRINTHMNVCLYNYYILYCKKNYMSILLN